MPNLLRGRWSRESRARLLALFGRQDSAALARQLERSLHSVRDEAARVFPRRTGRWTAAEVEELRSRLGRAPVEDVALAMGRTPDELRERLEALRGEPTRTGGLTDDERLDFRKRYGRLTDEDVCAVFRLAPSTVQRLAESFRLSKDKAFLSRLDVETKMPRWTADEVVKLRRLYATNSGLEVARQLGRSVKSVVSKAHQLGLSKTPERLSRMGRENRLKE